MAKGQDGVDVMSIIDLVLVKKQMLHVQDVSESSERNGRRKGVNRGRRIRSEKLREHHYMEG